MSPAFVYRLFDSSDELLYIGWTGDVERRVAGHRWRSPFGSRIARVESTEFGSRAAAVTAEHDAIYTEQPTFNKNHKAKRVPVPTDPDLVSLSVRVPRKMADRLKELADAEFRPVAAEIRRLIQAHIDEADAHLDVAA